VTRIVFLLVPGLHLLDLAGPAQAFRTAADLIIVPGWRSPMIAGTGAISATVLGRLAGHHADGGTVVSICAGADALGRAGLLDGRRCTTHHLIQDELAARYPGATIIRDVLYVVDGRIATSAGIASGIDLALHLIAVRDGPVIAALVAREMVVYARRNGDEQQASAMLRHRNHLSDVAHRAHPLPLADLAEACRVSERTLTRRFVAATGMTPLRYQQVLRLERAEHLIRHGATVEAAARTVGFADPRMLRRLRRRAA
jgi:transcriptional regulator GlxA family with amidase domain